MSFFHIKTSTKRSQDLWTYCTNFILLNIDNQSPTYHRIKKKSVYEETWLPSFVIDQ